MASNYYKFNRLKLVGLPQGKNNISIYRIDGDGDRFFVGNKTVYIDGKQCSEVGKYIYLKYLNRDGQYRFIAFDTKYTQNDVNTELGSVDKLVTDLEKGQGFKYSIGYTTERTIRVTKKGIGKEEFDEYMSLLASPRVYLQRDDEELNDEEENWLLVTVEDNGNNFISKKGTQTFSITIKLPDVQNICF